MPILATILALLHCDRPAPEPVDIARRLDGLADARPGSLDWRHSVVDLLTLLDLDSSGDNRYRLALELGYPGVMEHAGAMNAWLGGEIMRRLSDAGGKVPMELL